jgi:hypothetical protein
MTALVAAALLALGLLNSSDAVARGAGFHGGGMRAIGAHRSFGPRSSRTHWGATGAHHVARHLHRHDHGRHGEDRHKHDGKWQNASRFRGDHKASHAADGTWHERKSFGSNERRPRHVDGEWHAE